MIILVRVLPYYLSVLNSLLEGDYFDLSQIPERYTGYSGPDAHRVWTSIYRENCFGLSEMNLMGSNSAAPVTLPDTMTDVLREEGDSDTCLEKRVYYKVISGKVSQNLTAPAVHIVKVFMLLYLHTSAMIG